MTLIFYYKYFATFAMWLARRLDNFPRRRTSSSSHQTVGPGLTRVMTTLVITCIYTSCNRGTAEQLKLEGMRCRFPLSQFFSVCLLQTPCCPGVELNQFKRPLLLPLDPLAPYLTLLYFIRVDLTNLKCLAHFLML